MFINTFIICNSIEKKVNANKILKSVYTLNNEIPIKNLKKN